MLYYEILYYNVQYNYMMAHRMVSFHNFKSLNFKLSVSNPKKQYVVYVSVLSQISNCQSLGRKNKHKTLKTDRTASFQTKNLYIWSLGQASS